MRLRRILLIFAVLSLPLLSGCTETLQPEDHSYVLVASADRTDEGLFELGLLTYATSPSSSGGDEPDAGDANTYQRVYIIAHSPAEALDMAKTALPRSLNLTHLKLIGISQTLAMEPSFPELIEEMFITDHVFGTAYIAINLNSGREFLEAVRPHFTARLTSDLSTMLTNYSRHGYIPSTKLSSLYYMMNSFYSDPTVMLASSHNPEGNVRTFPAGMLGSGYAGSLPRLGLEGTEMMGCALIKDGQMVGMLDGGNTRWMRVLDGSLQKFDYICQDLALSLEIKYAPKVTVDLSGAHPKIHISLSVATLPRRVMPDLVVLEQQIRAELTTLLYHCQSLGVEPFNFAELAASQFLTIADFIQYDWNNQFQQAEISLDVKMVDVY